MEKQTKDFKNYRYYNFSMLNARTDCSNITQKKQKLNQQCLTKQYEKNGFRNNFGKL